MAARNKPRVHVVAEFAENGRVAVIRMQCADNRINPEFISDFNNALDEVERCRRHAEWPLVVSRLRPCTVILMFSIQHTYCTNHDYDWGGEFLLQWFRS